jgi:hypothetical protein
MGRDVTLLLSEDWELGTNSSNNNMLSDQVLKIDIDSYDIDNDLHRDPVYEMVAKRHTLKPVSFISLEITFDS